MYVFCLKPEDTHKNYKKKKKRIERDCIASLLPDYTF